MRRAFPNLLVAVVFCCLAACDTPTSQQSDVPDPPEAPAPARVEFTTSPPPLLSIGAEFTVRARVLDLLGNPIPTASGTMTLSVTSAQCSAVPSVNTTTVSAGQATFVGVSLDRAGYGFSLEANYDGVLGRSDPFTISEDGMWREGEWHSAGLLMSPRVRHSAALLEDGTVLIAGGANVNSPVAERFDPKFNQFSEVAPTHSSHANLSYMVPLGDGSVLLVGGTQGKVAERFTLSTSEFVELPSPVASRLGAGIVVLADGRVLLAGGLDIESGPGEAHDVVEFFDPATGQFTVGPALPERRTGPATALLPDGRVLMTGGARTTGGVGTPLMSGWIFDPIGGTYAPIPDASLSFTRAVNLEDGRVLLANPFHAAGIELFDQGIFTGSFATSALHLGGTVTPLPDGSVLIAGGFQQWAGDITSEVELFDPGSNAVIPVAPMSTGRTRHTATLLPDGRVLVTGGQGTEASAELFTPPACYGT